MSKFSRFFSGQIAVEKIKALQFESSQEPFCASAAEKG
jgi:hypothetical protein